MTNPILKADNINVYFGKSHILQGASLEVGEGITAVVGRNGMGKTTLMNALMGLVPATTEGKVTFQGEDITNLKPYKIARKGIGYVPQGRRIFPSLSVEEQLTFIYRKSGDPDGWTVEKVYDFFPRLKERRKNSGNHLSGGEQQMLAIGRALMLNPKLLIMDEPSEGLAPIIIEQLIDFCHRVKETGLSILLVEQSMYFAMNVSEIAHVMQNGMFVYNGNFKELMADEDKAQQILGIGA